MAGESNDQGEDCVYFVFCSFDLIPCIMAFARRLFKYYTQFPPSKVLASYLLYIPLNPHPTSPHPHTPRALLYSISYAMDAS